MSQSSQTFKIADLSKRFEAARVQFDTLLASATSKDLATVRQKLHDELQNYKQQGVLTVAFIGQYSAGKSTIISALTGRRDIYIDADIATDATTPYDWNGIKIIDTPGLFTDRTDHDDITYEAIAKADLLVFCLTHMLFDTLTVENFKKLAYDKGYRWKIMLVINKMSAAAGAEDQKIASYQYSLAESLKPYVLNEFPICFIDAKDYCEGIDEGDDFLIEVSHFDTFITELNRFVERRKSLTGLDTPVRILMGCLDDAQIGFARNSNEDTAFLEVLLRLSRRINKERERLRTKVKGIVLSMSQAIFTEGSRLASAVGNSGFEGLSKQSETNIGKHYEKAEHALNDAIKSAIESIRLEVEAEFQSNLAQAFVARLNFNGQGPSHTPLNNSNKQQLQDQVGWLQEVATALALSFPVGQGFLKPMSVAGSGLHQGVYGLGKFMGYRFKPWQAVGIARDISNAAMVLGPALALVSVGLEYHAMQKEHEYERKMADVRRDIISQFKTIAVDLEQQIEGQLQEFESQVYVQLEENIAKARQETDLAMAASHAEIGQIAMIRQELTAIIREVQEEFRGSKV